MLNGSWYILRMFENPLPKSSSEIETPASVSFLMFFSEFFHLYSSGTLFYSFFFFFFFFIFF